MSEQYGFYVSIRLPSGELLSSSRETVAEVKKDIDLALGEGTFDAISKKLAGTGATPSVAPPASPVASPQPQPVVNPTPTVAPGVSDIPSDGFESCAQCGTLKDVWKPPGVSKAGKPYTGFFSCPNWKNH